MSGIATIYYSWTMTYRNIIQRGTQTASLSVMISWRVLNSRHGVFDRYPSKVDCSFSYTSDSSFMYTNNEQITTQTRGHRAENGLGKNTNLNYTIILGATLQKECLEKIEIWTECTVFNTTSQILVDDEWTIIKKCSFYREILEI